MVKITRNLVNMTSKLPFGGSFTEDGNLYAVVNAENRVLVYDVVSRTVRFTCSDFAVGTAAPTSLTWCEGLESTKDSKRTKRSRDASISPPLLAIGTSRGEILLWNTTTAKLEKAYAAPSGPSSIISTSYYSELSILAVLYEKENDIVLWNVSSGLVSQRIKLKIPITSTSSIVIMRNCKFVAVSSHVISLYDIATASHVVDLSGHSKPEIALFSHRGFPILVSASRGDTFFNVWDLSKVEIGSSSSSSSNKKGQSLSPSGICIPSAPPFSIAVGECKNKSTSSGTKSKLSTCDVVIGSVGDDNLINIFKLSNFSSKRSRKQQRTDASKTLPLFPSTRSAPRDKFNIWSISHNVSDSSSSPSASIRISWGMSASALRFARCNIDSDTCTSVITDLVFDNDELLGKKQKKNDKKNDSKQKDETMMAVDDDSSSSRVMSSRELSLPIGSYGDAKQLTFAERLEMMMGKLQVESTRSSSSDPTNTNTNTNTTTTTTTNTRNEGEISTIATSGSVHIALQQALTSNDSRLLNTLLALQNPRTVYATCENISVEFVLPLLKHCIRILETGKGVVIMVWIRSVLQYHTAYLLGVEQAMKDALLPLYRVVELRLSQYRRLNRLSGRLELVLAHQKARKERLEKEALSLCVDDKYGVVVSASELKKVSFAEMNKMAKDGSMEGEHEHESNAMEEDDSSSELSSEDESSEAGTSSEESSDDED